MMNSPVVQQPETSSTMGEKTSCNLVDQGTAVSNDNTACLLGDPVSYATDAVTKEWFVKARDSVTGEPQAFHVTVADYTSVNPDAPRIVVGVNGQRWSVEVHYGFSAYPLCGPPCTYSWEVDGHTFELALDAISLRTWRGGLLLFVDGREAKSNQSKAFFWFKRFVSRAIIGVMWLVAGVAIHFLASKVTRGDENVHRMLLLLLFLGLSLITMVMVLPCAIGLSYLIVGCLGVFKFGLANVMPSAHSPKTTRPMGGRFPGKVKSSYVTLEEESPYAVAPIAI